MNIQVSDGVSVATSKDGVFINGERVDFPRSLPIRRQSVVNGKLYLDGYEYFPESKTFKRTIAAFVQNYIL